MGRRTARIEVAAGPAPASELAGDAGTLAVSPDDTLSPVRAHALSCINTPPAPIVQSSYQSLAAYAEGLSLSRQLPGSTVVTRNGDDYSMVLFSPCVQKIAAAYLTAQKLPAPGTTCSN
ncbi:alpha/beta hydrolase [Couchioplanes caeruleus]|uniref:Peptidase S33 tripeptidyl aminopeptidase-like C-terminal domain-containing protein n=1 Tax=Couchioplanes caeruleus subsp. caeruleus TaxID=56427 RepID=A0A1K0GDH2_9ACTN|nr:alpha/beta hydrolase [Couchioplanes caeruleus]OJF10198.1 hypothetical protein BG844_33330 [Couchioplanes caeruleus subsp. caeruleus]